MTTEKKDENPAANTVATVCPPEASTATVPPASAICATNIACWTQAPWCTGPQQQAQVPMTWFHTCGIPPVTMTCPPAAAQTIGQTGWQTCLQPTQLMGCTTVTSNPTFGGCGQQAQVQVPMTWFHTCGIPPVTMTCPQPAAQIGQTDYQHCAHTHATVCTMLQCHQQNTAATVCTQVGCVTTPQAQTIGITGWYTCHQPTQLLGCTTVTSNPTFGGCGTGPQGAAPQNVGQTGWYTCTQPIGQTGWQTCGHTLATVCTQLECHQQNTVATTCTQAGGGAGAQAQTIGHTGWYTCTQADTNIPGCNTATSETRCYGACTATTTVQNQNAPQNVGQTGWYTCGAGTAATVCTQYGCGTGPQAQNAPQNVGPTGWYTCTQPIGQTGWQACAHTLATVCTQLECHQQNTAATTCTQVNCGTNPQAQNVTTTIIVGPTGWYTCGQSPTCGNNTKIAATTWTQLGCAPTQLLGCTTATAQTMNTAATVCTRYTCPTQPIGCYTAVQNCQQGTGPQAQTFFPTLTGCGLPPTVTTVTITITA